MNIPIIFEDDFLIVIEKPTGMVVNKANSVAVETIQDWAEEKLQIQSASWRTKSEIPQTEFAARAGIVHRLDKDTSGLLLIAKKEDVFKNLQDQFLNRTVVKKYITLVHGKVAYEGEIKAPVGRLPWNRERFGILPGGREAITYYKRIELLSYNKGFYSLLEVSPQTGRTHQIRIHLKYIGNSVVSDPFYAGRKLYREDMKFCPRLFLHAAYIQFTHPDGKNVSFSCPLPSDLDLVIHAMIKV